MEIKKEKQRLIEYWESSGIIKDKKVIDAFKAVPREKFVDGKLIEEAYGDFPLPIGEDQTISQPTTVMIMTQALEVKEGMKILEVGAGSGYQAALLSKLAGEKGKVITTEIISALALKAKAKIEKLKLKNVDVVCWDGSKGYKKEAPYDRIIITAACPRIPTSLIAQLKEKGVIIAPVGGWLGQKMIKATKIKGKLKEENLGYFVFVPLKGEYGYE